MMYRSSQNEKRQHQSDRLQYPDCRRVPRREETRRRISQISTASGYNAFFNFIGGGADNQILSITSNSNYNAIGGGTTNTIDTGTTASFIGGGGKNCICENFTYSGIGGGFNNTVSASYSSIFGGSANVVNGAHSAIFGGSGNTVPAGCSYVGIFGCNITTVKSCAFHVNCAVVQNIPITSNPATCAPPFTAIPGTLYYVPVGSQKQVWVA